MMHFHRGSRCLDDHCLEFTRPASTKAWTQGMRFDSQPATLRMTKKACGQDARIRCHPFLHGRSPTIVDFIHQGAEVPFGL